MNDKELMVFHQVFSDMIYTAYPEIKESGNKSPISMTVMELNKYYNKKKMIVITDRKKLKETEELYLQKVKEIRDYSSEKQYSMSILIISMLDYFVNVIKDKEIVLKFGHKSLLNILDECERYHRELTFNCYKLINQTFKEKE